MLLWLYEIELKIGRIFNIDDAIRISVIETARAVDISIATASLFSGCSNELVIHST